MVRLIASPTVIPCVGNVTKGAEEFVGLVNTGDAGLSITRVKSPAGWEGPGQYADYREYRLVLSGTLHVERDEGDDLEVEAGQAIDIEAGEWVRYSTPQAADYITVCLPAFSRAAVHRDH